MSPTASVPLPVDSVLPELADALRGHGSAVLRAPTGSGKTTRVPPALLEAGVAGKRKVLVLEPRRLAARAAAQRIADERGWPLGERVGYHVRLDRRAGPKTRLVLVTEGILVRMLQDDPFLEDVGLVVFDEFHERSLQADLALGLVQRVRSEVRSDLGVLLMSATLDPAASARYLAATGPRRDDAVADTCPVISTGTRLHPVELRYAERPIPRRPRGVAEAAEAAAGGVRALLAETPGDLLVFLPGVGEIVHTEELLREAAVRGGFDLVRLHGTLPLSEQNAALRPHARRKVVLATNVAESSVTVEGVTGVVDTGLARQMRYDPSTGLNRLELVRISRASADQRAGRAGRERPGVCLRLWPEVEQPTLAADEAPEVLRVELSGAVLELLAWGETDLEAFPWFDPPPPDALVTARELLGRLGALGSDAAGPGLTRLGRTMARLPVHPRLARLLVEGHRLGHLREAALAAALLSERPAFRRRPGATGSGRSRESGASPVRATRSDLLDRLEALAPLDRLGRGDRRDRSRRHDDDFDRLTRQLGRLDRGAARYVLQVRDRLVSQAESLLGVPDQERRDRTADPEEAILRAVFTAHPDRLVRRRSPRSPHGVMVGGRGVVLGRESGVLDAELFVAVDLDAGRPGVHADALVRMASTVEREWLPDGSVTTETVVRFDAERERVVAARVSRFEDLVLDEREVPVEDEAEAARVLARAAAATPERALPLDHPAVTGFLQRVRFLRRWHPELGLPALPDLSAAADGDALEGAQRRTVTELLATLAAGKRSFAELRRAPLLDYLRGALTYHQLQALDREAPERIEVPSGSRVRLRYQGEEPPVLAVRIQEVFGLQETPRVAAGRVPVLLHLLAPNMRPQQVTDDLAGFWERTYPQVRKELAGRYPKHAWPEDPAHAQPERRPGRKRPR